MKMERRQKFLEEVLRKQHVQVYRISKELELHREFLNLQFESFMDFLMQNGGQLIQLSGKNGQEEETGVFFPMKREKSGSANNTNGGGNEEGGDNDSVDGAGEEREGDEEVNGDRKPAADEGGEGEDLEPLPPPQAILGPQSEDCSSEEIQEGGNNAKVHFKKQNRTRRHPNQDGGHHSRRSSQNVVSSTDAQHGDVDFDDVDSSQEYDSNDISVHPEMMKYDMNHFMFSHFLDEMNGNGEENGMDESYNDDEMGMYDGDGDDDIGLVGTSRPLPMGRQSSQWSAGNNSRTSNSNLHHQRNPKVNKIPPPSTGAPHNERTCRYCGKTFHWKQSWVIHERTHTGEKPYLCKCGKAFSQKSNMNTHAKSCAQAMTAQKGKTTVFQMKCSHCQKMFTHKKNLDLHMEKFHPEVLNLSVKPPSSASSPSSSQYHNHNHNHHHGGNGIESELSAAAAARAAENAAILQILKTASAQVTNNSLSKNLGSLSPSAGHNHNSSNSSNSSITEDRNGRYPCPYCSKRFPVKGTLERHLRVHTGEKPFLCGICGKAFTQKGSVKLHLERVHRQSI